MPELDHDPYVRWQVIANLLGGVSRRTIGEYMRRGKLPPPDLPARKLGESHLWRRSTVDRAVRNLSGGDTKPDQSTADKAA